METREEPMLCRPAGRLIGTLAAATIAGIGAAATAQPGGEPRELAPVATLSTDGGMEAPTEPDQTGAVQAPAAPRPPQPVAPAAQPLPTQEPSAAPAPVAPPEAAPPPDPVPSPPAEPAPADVAPVETPAAVETPAVDPPTPEEALGAEPETLVPVVVLASEAPAPLIDISPNTADAPALAAQVEQEEDGEVVIPVPPEDVDPDDEPRNDETDDTPAVVPRPEGPTLAVTGRELAAPLLTALALLLAGAALRFATSPSGAPVRA